MPIQDIGELALAYDEYGDLGDPAVILIHGWPDDASTWSSIAESLADAGRHVVVPTLRGFGATRFLSDTAARTGDSATIAMDIIALADALSIENFSVAGHDWGSSIAEALAVGWSGRVQRFCMLSTTPRMGGLATPSFEQAKLYWYQWFMATDRGADAVRRDPRGFARVQWENWSPPGWFDEATFEAVARSFDNPDWVDVTLHSYRSRWGFADLDPRSEWLAKKVKDTQSLSLPTLFIKGDEDGVTSRESFAKVPQKFSGLFEMVGLPGIGHFPTREAPAEVAEALVTFLRHDV